LPLSSYDIVVAGAGPAGITAAVKLHHFGFQVLLIAGSSSAYISELQSLSPGFFTLAETIGLDPERIYKLLTPVLKSQRRWSEIIEEKESGSGFLTERFYFDRKLLMMAEELGVKVLKPGKIINSMFLNDLWELEINQEGILGTIKTKFLVDATGKKSIIRGKKNRVGPQTVAITASWKNTSYPSASTFLESSPSCWIWGGRSHDEIFHATLFADPGEISGRSKLMELYSQVLGKSKLFKACVEGSIISKITAVETTPYYYEGPAGLNFIKTGESNLGFDPISSQGVQNTMSNAIQAAIVVNTLYKYPSNAGAALEFYRSQQQKTLRKHLTLTTETYLSALPWQDQPFWKNRIRKTSTLPHISFPQSGKWDSSTEVRVSSETSYKSVACIFGDQIVLKKGIVHPFLDEPIVYYGNLDAAKIVNSISGKVTISGLIDSWADLMSNESAIQLIQTFKRFGILETVR
jgi:flavin-dependent dehydrogenase